MVALTERQKGIIQYLLAAQEYVSIRQIGEVYQVSNRTIRYDLNVIEQACTAAAVRLERKPGAGIKLEQSLTGRAQLAKVLLSPVNRSFSPDERALVILCRLLLGNHVTIEQLANELVVSKNTIIADLATVEERCNRWGLLLQKKTYYGLQVVGEEERLRDAFSSFYSEAQRQLVQEKQGLKALLTVKDHSGEQILRELEQGLQVQYSGTARDELEVALLFSLYRAQNGQHIHYDESVLRQIRVKREYQVLQQVSVWGQAGLQLTDGDFAYLTRALLGAKIIYAMESCEVSAEDYEAKQLSKHIIQDAEEYLGVDFSNDIEFIHGLSVHLKVALYRLRNQLKIENPLVEQIKYRITFVYEMVRKIMAKYEPSVDCQFPDEEIAYVAMHVGAAFERSEQRGFRPKVLVVCGGGIATSGLLSTRLKIMIPELQMVEQTSLNDLPVRLQTEPVDFVIATMDLQLPACEVVVVNPLLDVKDIEIIKSLVFKKFYKKQCEYLIKRYKHHEQKLFLQELLPANQVQLNVSEVNWREAIRRCAQSLVKHKTIHQSYVEKMINAVETLGTYMVFIPGIAFAHASPEQAVLAEGISLLTLANPIYFGDKQQERVDVIVVFAAKDKHSRLLPQLVSILEVPANQKRLKQASCYQDIAWLSNE